MPGEANGRHNCCFSFVISCGFSALTLWLSLRTNKPTFSIEQFDVSALNTTANRQNTSIAVANRTVYFNLKLKNRNKDKGVFYDALNLTFYYALNSSFSIANATFPAFYQGHGHSAQRPLAVEAARGSWILQAEEAVEKNGSALFRMDLTTAVRYKIVFWKTKRHRLKLGSDLSINGNGNLVKGKKGVKLTSGAGKGPESRRALELVVVSGFILWWWNR